MQKPMNILQVSTADIGGGAEKVAWDLFRAYSAQGHNSWLAVGKKKKTTDANVVSLESDAYRSAWARFWLSLRRRQRDKFLIDLEWIGEPSRKLKIRQGLEDFEYPTT